jgi:predicted thioredoxin/glutaredoxin
MNNHFTSVAHARNYMDRLQHDAERMARRMGGEFVRNEFWLDVEVATLATITDDGNEAIAARGVE